MKKINKWKTLLTIVSATSIVALPFLTLTSCSNNNDGTINDVQRYNLSVSIPNEYSVNENETITIDPTNTIITNADINDLEYVWYVDNQMYSNDKILTYLNVKNNLNKKQIYLIVAIKNTNQWVKSNICTILVNNTNNGNNGSDTIEPSPPIPPNPLPPPSTNLLEINYDNLYTFLKTNLIQNNIVIKNDVLSVLNNNKDELVSSINSQLQVNQIQNISINNANEIIIDFVDNIRFNPQIKELLTLEKVSSNENTIIISNLGIINNPILNNNNQVVPEESYNDSFKLPWIPDECGSNDEEFSFNYSNNNNYDGNRKNKYANLETYNTLIQNETGFPGFPSFANNWSNNNSSAYLKMQSQVTPTKNINAVINEWEQKLKDDNIKYLNSQFILDEIRNNRLKKYPGIDTMFGNFSVTLDQQSVSRTYSISSIYPNSILLGLYAPAGEIIDMKIPINQIDIIKKMNLEINIGNEWQEFSNIERSNISFRLPKMNTSFSLNALIDYHYNQNNIINNELIVKFGSPIGGVIYFKNPKNLNDLINYGNTTFTIDGAIEYANYVYGYTTEQEWKRLVNNTRTPTFSVSAPFFCLLKPWFTEPNNDNLWLLNQAKINSPKYRTNFYNNVFKISQYLTSNDVGQINDTYLKTQLFFCQDYVAAGSAVNLGGYYVQLPIYEVGRIFENASANNTGAINDWCVEHEGNHSYERKYYPFNNHYSETFNNVLNIIENACIADETINRSENNFINSGWGRTNSGFNALNPQKNNETQKWLLTNDYWNNYAAYIHAVGTKFSTKWARTLSLIRKRLKGNYITINNKNWNYSALSYAIFSLIANVNLWDFIQNTQLMTYPEGDNWFNDQNNEVGIQYKEIYNQYIKKLPTYHPIGNLYASGVFLPRNIEHTTWEYAGDSVRPFVVYKDISHHFNIKKYTKFTNIQNNELATLKSISIVNQPKYGTIVLDSDSKGFTYLSNPNANINDRDEIIVEITDSFNEKSRILIRPLISLSSTYEDKIITYNPEFIFENKKISELIQSQSFNQIVNLFKQMPTLINNNNLVQSLEQQALAKDLNSPNIFLNRNIYSDQIRWSSFVWTAPKTGWYRINLNVMHDNYVAFDYACVNEYTSSSYNTNISNEQTLLWNQRWLKNANKEQYGHNYERETSPVWLEQNKNYVFNFFTTIYDRNSQISRTFEKMSINYLGNTEQDKLKNQIDLNQQPFANHIETKMFENYNQTIDALNKNINFILRNYLWYVENGDLFKNQYFIHGVNLNDEQLFCEKIGSLATFNNVTKSPNTTSADDTNTFINRFLGIDNNWVHITSVVNNHTQGGFDINLSKTINVKEIKIGFKWSDNARASAQKIRITNLDNNEVLYDDFIQNWWDNENAFILFNNITHLKHFRIEFIKAVDNRNTTNEIYKKVSQDSITSWIILNPNPLTFSNFTSDELRTYKYMKYGYSIFNENIQILGPWNITSNNALFDNKQLISRYNQSKIVINLNKGISGVAILGDQFSSSAEFNVYLDGQLYGSYNNHSNNPLVATILLEIRNLDKSKSHQIIIETTNANNDNPFSFQGILIQ